MIPGDTFGRQWLINRTPAFNCVGVATHHSGSARYVEAPECSLCNQALFLKERSWARAVHWLWMLKITRISLESLTEVVEGTSFLSSPLCCFPHYIYIACLSWRLHHCTLSDQFLITGIKSFTYYTVAMRIEGHGRVFKFILSASGRAWGNAESKPRTWSSSHFL